MKFKKIKYHILLCLMVLIFGGYVGVNLFMTSSSAEILPGPDIDNEEILPPEEEDKPSDDDYIPDTEDKELPSDALGLINYALDIYNNGKGFASTINGYLHAEGSVGNVSTWLKENVSGVANRNKNQSLEEMYITFQSEDMLMGILNNYKYNIQNYRAVNTDKSNDKAIFVSTREFDAKNKTYDFNHHTAKKQELSYNKGMNKAIMLNSQDFYFEISKDTVEVLLFDSRSSQFYHKIRVRYDVSKIPEQYKTYYGTMMPLPTCEFTKLEFEFLINKETGKLRKISRSEELNGEFLIEGSVFDGMVIKMKAKTSFTQTFSSMDKEAKVEERYKEFP